MTQKLLYVSKRARPDLETLISFLTTRVTKSDEDDWKKLKRGLIFIQNNIKDKRVIGKKILSEIFTWIDSSYAVHSNMRGHTGGAIYMGFGVIHCKAGKQKINVKSSTELELVGFSEYISYNIWLLMFMEAQGYGVEKNVIYQDNQSTMKMIIKGRSSCTGNSRHINVQYFLSRIESKMRNLKLSIVCRLT